MKLRPICFQNPSGPQCRASRSNITCLHGRMPTRKQEGVYKTRMQEYEKRLIMDALEKYEGNIKRTAEELGLVRASLYRKMNRLGLR